MPFNSQTDKQDFVFVLSHCAIIESVYISLDKAMDYVEKQCRACNINFNRIEWVRIQDFRAILIDSEGNQHDTGYTLRPTKLCQ